MEGNKGGETPYSHSPPSAIQLTEYISAGLLILKAIGPRKITGEILQSLSL